MRPVVLWLLTIWPLSSQSFEVASVRPAAIPGNGRMGKTYSTGGPGTGDPTRFTYINISMRGLVYRAFATDHYYKLEGPDWMDNEEYDVTGKIPAGTTKDQFQAMLQNLLAERFHMVTHHETRDLPSYELVVSKKGAKLKETDFVDTGTPAAGKTGPLPTDANGFPVLTRPNLAARFSGQTARMTAKAQTMKQLANMLSGRMPGPIVDKTGLTGRYDFTLEFAPTYDGAPPPGIDSLPPLEAALQEQLGLRLEGKKLPTDVLVIDKLEKVPAAN